MALFYGAIKSKKFAFVYSIKFRFILGYVAL